MRLTDGILALLLALSLGVILAGSGNLVSADEGAYLCKELPPENACNSTEDGCNSGLRTLTSLCTMTCNSGTNVICGSKSD